MGASAVAPGGLTLMPGSGLPGCMTGDRVKPGSADGVWMPLALPPAPGGVNGADVCANAGDVPSAMARAKSLRSILDVPLMV